MSEKRTVELKGGHLFDSLNYFSSFFKFQGRYLITSIEVEDVAKDNFR